jgi:hypothetical protein
MDKVSKLYILSMLIAIIGIIWLWVTATKSTIKWIKTDYPPTVTITMPTQEPTVTIKPLPTITKENNTMELPNEVKGTFKAYMDYRTITDNTSKQSMLQGIAMTDSDGFRRFSGCYLVAMGSHYAKRIGERFFVQFENKTVEVMIGDFKDDKHTIDGMYCKANGSIVEFIIDSKVMTHEKLQEYFKGNILSIRKE